MCAGCAHDEGPRSGVVEARAYHYQDDSGLLVGTYGVAGSQRLRNATVEAKALADYVRIDSRQAYDPSPAVAGSRAPDAVTSASSTAGGGEVARKWRFEGQAGLTYDRPIRARPAWVGALARASTEPDYRSVSAAVRTGVELFDRNTTVTAMLGYGHDTVEPVEAPPGQQGQWPASHERWAAIVLSVSCCHPRWCSPPGSAGRASGAACRTRIGARS